MTRTASTSRPGKSGTRRRAARPRSHARSADARPTIRKGERRKLLQEGATLARKALTQGSPTALLTAAPTAWAIGGRYLRRKPVKTIGIALAVMAVVWLGRSLLGGAAPTPAHGVPRQG